MAAPNTQTSDPSSNPQVITSQPEPEKTKGSGKGLKIALIVLGIFTFVILSELGYLIFSGYGRTFFELNPIELGKTPVPIPIPQITNDQELPVNEVNPDKVKAFAERLDFLWNNKGAFLDRAVIEWSISGKVYEITDDYKNGSPYAISILDENEDLLTYSLTQKEYETLKAYLVEGYEIKSISVFDIYPGDQILIKSISNLLDTSNDFQIIFQVQRGG